MPTGRSVGKIVVNFEARKIRHRIPCLMTSARTEEHTFGTIAVEMKCAWTRTARCENNRKSTEHDGIKASCCFDKGFVYVRRPKQL